MNPTIYEQLGAANLEIMVNHFYDLVLQNEILSPLFQSDMETVRHKQLLFLTQFLGGPTLYNQTYGHPRLRMRHLPHKITEAAAIEWLKCMNQAINQLEIDDSLKTTLFNAFPRAAAHMVNTRS